MAGEDSKMQNALWWIASIAASVLCCSVLFVLFAGYLVEVKQDIKESNMRINAIEQREDTILANIESLRKHDAGAVMAVPSNENGTPDVPAAVAPASAVAPATAPAAVTVPVTPPPFKQPSAAPQEKK